MHVRRMKGACVAIDLKQTMDYITLKTSKTSIVGGQLELTVEGSVLLGSAQENCSAM